MTGRVTTGGWLKLLAFVALILLVGFLIGHASDPKAAYAAFRKPWFAPPAWVFGPVWSVLYIMIAIAGWRLHERDPASPEMRLWWSQLALNFLWSPVFFMAEGRGAALVIILALLILLLTLVGRLWRDDRTTMLLLVPYAGWVAFATLLNAAIVSLN